MSAEELNAEKETYLREAILEAGYNGSKFAEYLSSAKGKKIVAFEI